MKYLIRYDHRGILADTYWIPAGPGETVGDWKMRDDPGLRFLTAEEVLVELVHLRKIGISGKYLAVVRAGIDEVVFYVADHA